MKLKGYLFTADKSAEVVETQNKLENLYELLNCDLIETLDIKLGSRDFTIICDEEGLLKNNVIFTAVNEPLTIGIAGSMLVVRTDQNGNFKSLNNQDIKKIERFIVKNKDISGAFAKEFLIIEV